MTEDLAALALGAAGSLHCVAMCGPLMLLWRASPAASAGAAGYVAAGVYHAGRLSMYALAGLVAGQAGQSIAFRGGGRALAWLAGSLLLVGAASHLGLRLPLPSLSPMRWVAPLVRAARARGAHHPLAVSFAGGALNAWLPCGMLYAALAAAAALGDPVTAFRFMLLFGLGTTPALAAVMLAGGWLTADARRGLRYATPIALALVGLLLIARGQADREPADRSVRAATHSH
jgi:sulfite exporter TauE/SafE